MQVKRMSCPLLCTLALFTFAGLIASEDIPFTGGSHPDRAAPGEVWCLITTPPQFKTVSEEVMCAPASCRYEKIPAVYETQCEQVCSRKERTRCIDIPAVYGSENYEVEKCAARTEWQKVNCDALNVSAEMRERKGECVALVTIPATFETRCRQIVLTPASTRTEIIPAEFKTVSKRVCVSPESKNRIEIPAVYETRTKEVCVSPATKVWRLSSCNAPIGVSSCNKCERTERKCNTCNPCCSEPTVFMYETNYNDGYTRHVSSRR